MLLFFVVGYHLFFTATQKRKVLRAFIYSHFIEKNTHFFRKSLLDAAKKSDRTVIFDTFAEIFASMKLLIKRATIIDDSSKYHQQEKDILVQDGKIDEIGDNIVTADATVVACEGLVVCNGLIDIGAQVGEPGYEQREDLQSITKAAARGGFTSIAALPNTHPTIHSKSEVTYLKQFSQNNLIDILPIGAISKQCAGQELAELYDMHTHGAIAFSDGQNALQHAGVMQRALDYAKAFQGVVMNTAFDQSIGAGGQINEGKISTTLGLKGIPKHAEILMLQRDLALLEYTRGRLHVQNISCAAAVEAIRKAKAAGLHVSASVAVFNIAFTDDYLSTFDPNYKVLPPLRLAEDTAALQAGLLDGTIDFLSSNHTPWESEYKRLEFPYAEFGASTIETAFSLSYQVLKKHTSIDQIIALWTTRPKTALALAQHSIETGQAADLTLFEPNTKWTYDTTMVQSKSYNSPLLGQTLEGKIAGIIRGKQYQLF